MPAITKRAHNLSFCRKQTSFLLYYLYLHTPFKVKKMYLHILWNISWVTTDTHILKEKAFSPLILLCCNLEVSLCFWCFCSALRFPFPSKFSYSQLGQMGTSATANLLIHFTETWKKLKWLVQSQPCRHCYPCFSFAGIHLFPPKKQSTQMCWMAVNIHHL